MSVADTSGVASLAALMAQLATGKPVRAAAFASEHGLARSSVFDIARRLQEAGFLTRDDAGGLVAGPQARALAWSSCGLGRLSGPAEAVATWLRDHADGAVRLTAGDIVLLDFCGSKPGADDLTFQRALTDEKGIERGRLRLTVKPGAGEMAALCLERAGLTLENYLRHGP